MSTPAHADVETILQDVRDERRQFDAFLRGYVHGMQDHEADVTINSPDALHDRVDTLFDPEDSDDER